MLFAVQRSENELPSVVEIIGEILESSAVASSGPPLVSGAAIHARRVEQTRFLTNVGFAHEWDPWTMRTRRGDKEDRESVRMERVGYMSGQEAILRARSTVASQSYP